jgi:hypothetical protein
VIAILEFIFQDFWHWLGAVILILAIAEVPGGIIRVVVKRITKGKEEQP